MFSFFFVRAKRRLRTRFRPIRRWMGLYPQRAFRYLGFFFIFLFSISSPPSGPLSGEVSAGASSGGGEIAGAEAPSPFEPILQEEDYSPTYPRRIPDSEDLPPLTARAILVLDGESGKILYKKNIHESRSPASLTKIMTALVSLERYSLDEELLAPADWWREGECGDASLWAPLEFGFGCGLRFGSWGSERGRVRESDEPAG